MTGSGDIPVAPPVGRTIAERFAKRVEFNVPGHGNPKLARFIERVNADDDLYSLWLAANVNAMERLGMTDHGPVHVKIVMNLANKLYRLLVDGGIVPGVVTHWGLEVADGELVVAAGALLHDIGMSIHRSDHESYSLFLAERKLQTLLEGIYEPREATVIRSEVLHAIIAHRSGGKPLTMEAGVVRVADALDMAKGRSRIPFAAGSSSIHSISAAAVDGVVLQKGERKPVHLCVELSNSAGVFQLDQLFREKLIGSGLEAHIELEAKILGEEKQLVKEFRIL